MTAEIFFFFVLNLNFFMMGLEFPPLPIFLISFD